MPRCHQIVFLRNTRPDETLTLQVPETPRVISDGLASSQREPTLEGLGVRRRARREPLKRAERPLPEHGSSKGQNLALTIAIVPTSLDGGEI